MENTITDHQTVLMELWYVFDSNCARNHIKYQLYAGSALGAVRHHGIIPWDDDLDVVMLREDYNRFMGIAESELDKNQYFLQREFTEHWPMFFSKLRKNNTACIERYIPKDWETHMGIYIDIFPCDKLEKRLAVALNSGSEIIYCSYSLISSDGQKISDYIVPTQTSYDDMLKESVFSCSTTLLAKSVVDNNRFSADYYHEDLVYWLQLLKNGYSASACCEPLADYRIVEGSRSHSKLQSAKNRWEVYRKVEKLSLLKSLSVFLSYTVRGLRKYKRV